DEQKHRRSSAKEYNNECATSQSLVMLPVSFASF
ncbi:unnamed protein product, partial [Cuscuta campestris]